MIAACETKWHKHRWPYLFIRNDHWSYIDTKKWGRCDIYI